MLAVAAADFGGGPAVVLDFVQRLEGDRPVLVSFAARHALLFFAVAFEVELHHPLAEGPYPIARRHSVLDHVAAIKITTHDRIVEIVDVLHVLLRRGDEIIPDNLYRDP